MSRCAIYARFSTDHQNPRSAEDQVRICSERAEREGWTVVQAYSDLAISGTSNRRPGMTQMLADAAAGAFDIVLAEDLDRISRDLEDVAGIHKRLVFAGIKLVTLSDGAVELMHVAFRGAMNQAELSKMAAKIRRGQESAVKRGRVPGGRCYGYDVVPILNDDGSVERGLRRINEAEAETVRRIYAEYLAGRAAKSIAHGLNADGIPSPHGREWRAPAITGSRGRLIGVLRNPIYSGRFVYGRVRMLKDPESRNRVSRLNDPAELTWQDMPELAIVSRAEWDQVQASIDAIGMLTRGARARARPRRLLSGLVKCGICGGNYTVVTSQRWACSRHREAGTCSNGRRIGTPELEERVLAGLKLKLLAPEAVELLVRRFHAERDRQANRTAKSRSATELRLEQAEAAVKRLVHAIADGSGSMEDFADVLRDRQAERDRLRSELAEMAATSVIALHPHIAAVYRKQISALQLTTGDATADASLALQIRALVDRVTITPTASGPVGIEVLGSLQAVLDMAENKRPAPKNGAARMLSMVAEERYPRKQPGRSFRA